MVPPADAGGIDLSGSPAVVKDSISLVSTTRVSRWIEHSTRIDRWFHPLTQVVLTLVEQREE